MCGLEISKVLLHFILKFELHLVKGSWPDGGKHVMKLEVFNYLVAMNTLLASAFWPPMLPSR